jgi:hypothetical protein
MGKRPLSAALIAVAASPDAGDEGIEAWLIARRGESL